MRHLFFGTALCLGLLMIAPTGAVRADSDSGASSDRKGAKSGSKGSKGGKGGKGGSRGVPELDSAVAGSAIVLLLGGVAYIASRRRKDDSA